MIRVLIIEDDPVQVELVLAQSAHLKILFELDFVTSAEAALAFLRAEGAYRERSPPDLVLLDLQLPGMSGGELLALLREDPALAQIPVVVLSAAEPSRAQQKEFAQHARTWVEKPLGLEAWAKIVRAVPSLAMALVKLPNTKAAS